MLIFINTMICYVIFFYKFKQDEIYLKYALKKFEGREKILVVQSQFEKWDTRIGEWEWEKVEIELPQMEVP